MDFVVWTYVFRARITGSEVELPAVELSPADPAPRPTGGTPAA